MKSIDLMSNIYRELDRLQAELQIMSPLVGYPTDMQDQLVSYAEGVVTLLRSEEGVWGWNVVHSSLYTTRFGSSRECLIIVDVPLTTTTAWVYITARSIKSIDIYGITHPGTPYYTHSSLKDLVLHLRGITERRLQWEAILKKCGNCLYSNSRVYPQHCGIGMIMDSTCTQYRQQ